MKVYNISLIGTGATINESKQILMQNKTRKYNHVVYTSLVGAHSNLAPPPLSLRSKYSFLCFTDKYFECDGWDVIVMQQNKSQSPRRAAKRPKIQPWNYFTANVICSNVYIGPLVKIGHNNIINSSSVIEHEVQISNNCHTAPSSTICGRSSLGKNCFLGANATIIDKINICNGTTIGAGSTVINPVVDENLTLVGSPAKIISSK